MALFLAFLVLTATVVSMITLSQLGQLALAPVFAITLVLGEFATTNHPAGAYFVVGLTTLTLAINVVGDFVPSRGFVAPAILLNLAVSQSSSS